MFIRGDDTHNKFVFLYLFCGRLWEEMANGLKQFQNRTQSWWTLEILCTDGPLTNSYRRWDFLKDSVFCWKNLPVLALQQVILQSCWQFGEIKYFNPCVTGVGLSTGGWPCTLPPVYKLHCTGPPPPLCTDPMFRSPIHSTGAHPALSRPPPPKLLHGFFQKLANGLCYV